MNAYQKLVQAAKRFEGDTHDHMIEVYPIRPDREMYQFTTAGPRGHHWANLQCGRGYWTFVGESCAFVGRSGLCIPAMLGECIIDKNGLLRGYIVSGEHESFSSFEARNDLKQLKKDCPEWTDAIKSVLASAWETRKELLNVCQVVDGVHDSELEMNLPDGQSITDEWAWASVCIANMLASDEAQARFKMDGLNVHVEGLEELIQDSIV